MNDWIVFGKYKWSAAIAEIAREHHKGDLRTILLTRYAAYRHSA